MKFILTCILFIGSIPFSQSQKYSRVKVFANQQELLNLSNLGVPTDHGMRKKNTFLISDFSENEIQIIGSYNSRKFGCSGEEFFDGMHPKSSCLSKLFTNNHE